MQECGLDKLKRFKLTAIMVKDMCTGVLLKAKSYGCVREFVQIIIPI